MSSVSVSAVMSTHFTIPLYRSPCSGGRYQSVPAGLSSYLSQAEYSASMLRIRAANRAPIATRMLMLVAWLTYIASLCQVCGLFNINGVSYGSYYVDGTWLGWSFGIASFVALIALARHSRKTRSAQLAAAVQLEHATYSPTLAWRVVSDRLIEIDVVDAARQHILALEQQVHILQAQVAAQAQHQAVDHELIAQQAAAAAATAHHAYHGSSQYVAPSASAVPAGPSSPYRVQYYPSVPVAEPVYAQSVYQPTAGSVFAHPPPQYYAAQPRNDMRAPLVHNHY